MQGGALQGATAVAVVDKGERIGNLPALAERIVAAALSLDVERGSVALVFGRPAYVNRHSVRLGHIGQPVHIGSTSAIELRIRASIIPQWGARTGDLAIN